MESIYDYLTAYGAVDPVNWPLYIGYMPDDQDQTLALYETGGYPADTLLRENQRVTFQYRVRGGRRDYPTVRAKWQEVFNLLQDADQYAAYPYLDTVIFIQAMHYGPLVFTDDKSRVNMTVNYRVMLTPAPVVLTAKGQRPVEGRNF